MAATQAPGPRLQALDGPGLLRAFAGGVAWLGENKNIVDSLNVFPVPDGDTGTNMYLTLTSALREAEKAGSAGVGPVGDAIAMGSLMGARGNSGVIFSQLMRGFAKRLHGAEQADPVEFAAALQEASNVAYKAVMRPVEGTILTVARMGARAALHAAREGKDILGVLDAAIRQSEMTLERTPDMLATLKEAGVVDAGGKGFVFFLLGFASALRGEPMPRPTQEAVPEAAPPRAQVAAEPVRAARQRLEYTYCTEFIVRGDRLDADAIRRSISSEGDSMLVVGGPDAIKVHIHTNFPGRVLEACISQGSLHEIHINNMEDQEEEFRARGGPEPVTGAKPSPVREVGVVAVAVGEGIEAILRSLGADVIVTGGQTMNPSIQEIVAAVDSVAAKDVIVLPNNSNVVLTARQAAQVAQTNVHVIPTRTVPQGMAALLAVSQQASLEENIARMTEAADRVKTGEITYSVRDSKVNGFTIRENDVIGLLDGELTVAG
ncbi:MAG: DAK2 domain-containing protein, partial [Firmicutes bacterium]|nr:DAK2 domain-containing protein [Bacillota bacterium]